MYKTHKTSNRFNSAIKRILGLVGISLVFSQGVSASCTYSIQSEWNTGFIANITIKNDTGVTINGWSVNWRYSANRMTNGWGAQYSGANPYKATSLSWNARIPVGQSFTFGVQGVKNKGAAEIPAVTGAVCNGSRSSVTSSSRSSSMISSSRSSSKSSSSRSSSSKSSSRSVSSSSSSSISSSTSISSSSTSACSGAEGEIFNNCLVTGEMTSYVYYGTGVGETSIDGETGSHIQWGIIDSEDDVHGNVIQVKFNPLDPYETQNDSGWFGITVGQGMPAVDLSEYANGSINFDMKIIQNGWYSDMYEFSMDCGWPCSSDALWVQEPVIGEWKSYSVSLEHVIRSGLDISKVYIPFMLKPAWELQKGLYIYQIDNIRLSKTYTDDFVAPEKPATDKLKNYYVNGSDAESNFAVTNNANNDNVLITEIQSGAEKFIDLQYLSNVAAEFYIYPANSLQYDMTDFYHGNLVFDLKVSNYSDEAGRIIVNSFCRWPCRAVPAYDAGRPPVGEWTTHIVPIKQFVKDGLLLHRMFNGFHLKYSSEVRTGLNIQLKNIRWEYTAGN